MEGLRCKLIGESLKEQILIELRQDHLIRSRRSDFMHLRPLIEHDLILLDLGRDLRIILVQIVPANYLVIELLREPVLVQGRKLLGSVDHNRILIKNYGPTIYVQNSILQK